MLEHFLIFTPLLLLPVIALLGFAGCLSKPQIPARVMMHVETVVASAPAGSNSSITAGPLMLEGGELIIAVVQWKPMTVTDHPILPAEFVTLAGPFPWNAMQVQVYSARNPDGNAQFPVTVMLHGSSVPWTLCLSAYSGSDQNTPFYGPQTSMLGYTGSMPQTPPLNTGGEDMVYAVAFAANSDGTFPGNSTLAAGSGFTAEFTAATNPLVEDTYGNGNIVTPAAQITNNDANEPLGFIFAVGLKAAS